MSEIEVIIESAPKYNGNPEIVFEWCKNLETHLLNRKWETIPNKEVKRFHASQEQLEKR